MITGNSLNKCIGRRLSKVSSCLCTLNNATCDQVSCAKVFWDLRTWVEERLPGTVHARHASAYGWQLHPRLHQMEGVKCQMVSCNVLASVKLMCS